MHFHQQLNQLLRFRPHRRIGNALQLLHSFTELPHSIAEILVVRHDPPFQFRSKGGHSLAQSPNCVPEPPPTPCWTTSPTQGCKPNIGECLVSSTLPFPRYIWTPHGRHGSKLRTARMMSMPLNLSGPFSSKMGVFCTASSYGPAVPYTSRGFAFQGVGG